MWEDGDEGKGQCGGFYLSSSLSGSLQISEPPDKHLKVMDIVCGGGRILGRTVHPGSHGCLLHSRRAVPGRDLVANVYQ